jgi:hypothetical protein
MPTTSVHKLRAAYRRNPSKLREMRAAMSDFYFNGEEDTELIPEGELVGRLKEEAIELYVTKEDASFLQFVDWDAYAECARNNDYVAVDLFGATYYYETR